jgi:prepilin-type N-terminal cleavage/methylation domain-containing protein
MRGFTVVELVVTMAITGVIAMALVTQVDDSRTASRQSAAVLRWASAANTAFARIGRDARAADQVSVDESMGFDAVRWTLKDGLLRRDAEVFARDVAAARFSIAGDLLRVELDFDARFGTYHTTASHSTRVALRRAP